VKRGKEKGGDVLCVFGFVYGLFLSRTIATANPTAIAMIMAMVEPKTYVSVIDGGSGSGSAGAGGAGSTANELTACDGQ
jgi:hypothetical protein